MTQLQMLGIALLIIAAGSAWLNSEIRKTGRIRISRIRIGNLPAVLTRQSHPQVIEAYIRATAVITPLAVILGIVFLLIRP